MVHVSGFSRWDTDYIYIEGLFLVQLENRNYSGRVGGQAEPQFLQSHPKHPSNNIIVFLAIAGTRSRSVPCLPAPLRS